MTIGEIMGHLTFAALLYLLVPDTGWCRPWRALTLAGCLALALLPVGGLSLGDFVRSYTDDLALTTLLWLLWTVGGKVAGWGGRLGLHRRRELMWTFALLALALYPATLGLSRFDPYRLGYAPTLLLAAVWGLSLWLWWRKNLLGVGLFACATLAWLFDLKDSDNYWDYIIDPVLGVYAGGYLLVAGCRRLCRRKPAVGGGGGACGA